MGMHWARRAGVSWWQFVFLCAVAYLTWRPARYVRCDAVAVAVAVAVVQLVTGMIAGMVLMAGAADAVAVCTCMVIAIACHRVSMPSYFHDGVCIVCALLSMYMSNVRPAEVNPSFWAYMGLVTSCLLATAPCYTALRIGYSVVFAALAISLQRDVTASAALLPICILAEHACVNAIPAALARGVDPPEYLKKRNACLWYVLAWSLTLGFIACRFVPWAVGLQTLHLLLLYISPDDSKMNATACPNIKTASAGVRIFKL